MRVVKLLFRVHFKGEQTGYGKNKKVGTVKLGPVYPQEGTDDSAEVKTFYEATPSGGLEFGTINEAALAQFNVGDDFYITLERKEAAGV